MARFVKDSGISAIPLSTTAIPNHAVHFFANRVCEAIDLGLKNAAERSGKTYIPRSKEAIENERTEVAAFSSFALRNTYAEFFVLLGALVYVERARAAIIVVDES